MKSAPNSVQDYIKSGEYFADAKKWYAFKYILPLTQRSFALILTSSVFIVLLGIGLNINSLFPIVKHVRYSINSDTFQTSANIIPADQITNDPLGSIADIMVRNYVIHREAYDYDQLKTQFAFMQSNSTRLVFRKFYNYMNLDNPLSPVLKYQKYVRRSVNILSADYPIENEAVVRFTTIAKSSSGEIIENMVWQATVNFAIDQINLNLAPDSRFNFAITDYRIKLLEDKINK